MESAERLWSQYRSILGILVLLTTVPLAAVFWLRGSSYCESLLSCTASPAGSRNSSCSPNFIAYTLLASSFYADFPSPIQL
jgi:hypothetical protein